MGVMAIVGVGTIVRMSGLQVGSIQVKPLMRVCCRSGELASLPQFRANHGRSDRTPNGEQQRNQQQHEDAESFQGKRRNSAQARDEPKERA